MFPGVDQLKFCTNKIVILDKIEDPMSKANDGVYNYGYNNIGNFNIGKHNRGNNNTGDYNMGACNSGDRNHGSRNTGSINIGDENSGYRNIGDNNLGTDNYGSRNIGDFNIGYENVGSFNIGNRNTGKFCAGKKLAGLFNTNRVYTSDDEIAIFNTAISKSMDSITSGSIVATVHALEQQFYYEESITLNEHNFAEIDSILANVNGNNDQYIEYIREKRNAMWNRTDNEISPTAISELHKKVYSLPNFNPVIFEKCTMIKIDMEEYNEFLENKEKS